VTVTLTSDEALVLFECLHRLEAQGRLKEIAVHGGEVVALWALSGQLETALTAPFQADYLDVVDAARGRLRARVGDPDPLQT
jgi:thiamine biosynthesis protein ThiC